MCRFIESIKLLDGVFYRIKFHRNRMNICTDLFYPDADPIDFQSALNNSDSPQKVYISTKLHSIQKFGK